jgi:hypothetical protein
MTFLGNQNGKNCVLKIKERSSQSIRNRDGILLKYQAVFKLISVSLE